jgi:DNA-binding Lrp family transcriptional regulator
MFNLNSRKYVIKTAMRNLNISKQEAEKRIDALLKSGILEDGSPDDVMTQMLIENFLRFDLSKLDYKEVFQQTMAFPTLIAAYDKQEGQHLAGTLKSIKVGEYDFEDVKEQIQSFDKFFCHKIWNRFPGVQKYDEKVSI